MYKILGSDKKEYGPVSADQLRQWIRENRANAETMVLPEGGASWVALGTVPEFAGSFGVAAASAPASISVHIVDQQRAHPLAIAGMIVGILSVFTFCCCYGLPLNLLGIVFGIIALVQIRSNPTRYSGKGMAIAGLATGILSVLLAIAWLIVIVASGPNPAWLQKLEQLGK